MRPPVPDAIEGYVNYLAHVQESMSDFRAVLERGPDPDSPTRYGRMARISRRLILRLLRHYRVYELTMHQMVLEYVQGAFERLDALQRQACKHGQELQQERQLIDNLAIAFGKTGLSYALTASDLAACLTAEGRAELWRERLSHDLGAGRLSFAGEEFVGAVRLDTDLGSLLFPAADKVMTPIVGRRGCWEPEECRVLASLLSPGNSFVDIGAHVGYITLFAARIVGPSGRGIAIEPAPLNFSLLSANLAKAGVFNVVAVPAAAWSENALLQLSLSSDNTGDHRIASQRESAFVSVPGLALDDVIPSDFDIDVVKIDTQGRDHVAIRGMIKTLERCRPTLVVEFCPEDVSEFGEKPADVLDLYRSLGLRIEVLSGSQVKDDNAALIEYARQCESLYCTLVLSPQERDPILGV